MTNFIITVLIWFVAFNTVIVSVEKCYKPQLLNIISIESLTPSAPPSVSTLSCVDISEDVNGAVNVTLSWTRSDADSYLINIITNTPQTPYEGLLNTGNVTQHEVTGFTAGYDYNITVNGVICGGLQGNKSEPLTIKPEGIHCVIQNFKSYLGCNILISHVVFVLLWPVS